MKKPKTLLFKALKWISTGALSVYFFIVLIFGFRDSDGNIGIRYFHLPGWEALDKRIETNLDGIDGPYLFGQSLYQVNECNEIICRTIRRNDPIRVTVNNEEADEFFVRLKSCYEKEEAVYSQPSKLIAISDIEGNFNAFQSFLLCNEVMDTNYNWTFGNGHLVLLGDFVDRGEDAIQVLWLAYSLEGKAEEQGGKVHFILGNHEARHIQGQSGFVSEKYIRAAQEISGEQDWEKALRFVFSESSELGRWLRTKNAVEKIGGYLFTHAGLSPDIAGLGLSIYEINDIIRKNIDKDLYHHPGSDETANFLLGKTGPLWYSGLARNYKYYDKASENEVDEILCYFEAGKIVVGHVVVEEVTTDYDGKLIKIDLKHGEEKCSGKTKGLLIEDRAVYEIDDMGNRGVL